MDQGLSAAVGIAMGAARRCVDLLESVRGQSSLPTEVVRVVTAAAGVGAATLKSARDGLSSDSPEAIARLLHHSMVDFQALRGLAGIAASFDPAPRNGQHVADAMRYTAGRIFAEPIEADETIGRSCN